jgi:putative ABC transport system ATP-binding protein
VWLAGQRFSSRGPAAQARLRARHIGVLTQNSGLIEHLSVLGNVMLAASFRPPVRRLSRARTLPAAIELLDRLGIVDRSRARPSTLSGGETARANLAVALIGGPLVLLADEPTAEVSRDEETAVLALLQETRPAAGGTVLVTHSRAVAAAADRVLELSDGRLR